MWRPSSPPRAPASKDQLLFGERLPCTRLLAKSFLCKYYIYSSFQLIVPIL